MSAFTECVCGAEADTLVLVHWADGDAIYRYCPICADMIVEAIEGAEEIPS